MRAFELATSIPWAIREESLETILEIAARVNPSVELIEAQLNRKLDNKGGNTEVRDGVAIIDIKGPIFRYGNMFTDVSGATSVQNLDRDFRAALADDDVKAILFNVDSPGGEANGINEFAEKVFNARGKKPLVSYVSGSGCSGAYWIASACDEIITDATSTLGSIGVAAVVKDTEERDTRAGVKNIKFVSSKSPNKRPDLNTTEGRSVLQENIDAIADVFIERIARNRTNAFTSRGLDVNQVSPDTVVKNFGMGGTKVGAEAVRVGLADRLGSFEQTLSDLIQNESLTNNNKETHMKSDNVNTVIEKTDAKLAEEEAARIAAEEEATRVAAEKEAARVAAEEEARVAAEAARVAEEEEAARVAAEAAARQEEQTQMAELQAKLEAATKRANEAESKALALEAASYSDKLLGEGKLIPAQTDAFIASYVQASLDDRNSPIENFSRVKNFVEMYEAKPAHGLTSAQLNAQRTITLLGEREDDEDKDLFAEIDAQAKAYAEELRTRKTAKR